MLRRWPLLLFTLVLSAVVLPVTGQETATGQFWVRAFEDRNGDAVRDPGEPLITGGLGVSLLNADGIVIATALLDGSPYAAQGQIGFQFLPPGDYTLTIAAPEFTATTPESFTRTIAAGTVPLVVEFGGQRIDLNALPAGAASVAPTESILFGLVPVTAVQRAEFARLTLAALAAVVVAGSMFLLGLFIYVALLRTKHRRAMAALRARYATGEYAAERSTGSFRPVTGTGSMPPVRTATGEVPAAPKSDSPR